VGGKKPLFFTPKFERGILGKYIFSGKRPGREEITPHWRTILVVSHRWFNPPEKFCNL